MPVSLAGLCISASSMLQRGAKAGRKWQGCEGNSDLDRSGGRGVKGGSEIQGEGGPSEEGQ